MKKEIWQKTLVVMVLCVILSFSSACTGINALGSVSGVNISNTTQPTEAATLTTTATTVPPTNTPAPSTTPVPTIAPTLVPIQIKAGQDVTVPILLYHHIADDSTGNRYFVSPAVFEAQMKWLSDNHYQTITITQLANVIIYGGQLPARAVAITFDDGNQDVVKNAFPIMQKYGFIGTAYIIVSWVGAVGYDTADQIAQLHNAGWEIGSHTMSHVDLTKHEDNLEYEVRNSLIELDKKYGVDVKSLAYPFGLIDPKVVTYTAHAGYTSGVGLGTSVKQGLSDLYYLSRMEVRQEYSMDQFIALLPWKN